MAEFEALLNESLELETPKEGNVVKGRVIAVEAGQAITVDDIKTARFRHIFSLLFLCIPNDVLGGN